MKLIGALTSKQYAFKARPWELESISTIDYHDANGSNILVSVRGSQIMRVLPKVNAYLNDEWISDKVRFSYDGFSKQRLFYPMLRVNGNLEKVSWQQAFDIIKDKFEKGYFFEGIYGAHCDAESILLFKEFLNKIGNATINNRMAKLIEADLRVDYLFNSNTENLEKAKVCLFLGVNPRYESPLFNLKLRKCALENNLVVSVIGYTRDLTYSSYSIGNSTRLPVDIVEGKNMVCTPLSMDQKPLLFTGVDGLKATKSNLLELLKKLVIKEEWNGFNVVHQNTDTIIGAELGCVNKRFESDYAYDKKVLYVYNADDIELNKDQNNFIIYQGHSADYIATQANLILPGSAIVEKNGTTINNEGLKQKLNFCVKPPAEARNDWKIFEALTNHLGLFMEYLNLNNVTNKVNYLVPDISESQLIINKPTNLSYINNGYICCSMNNFYMTDSISRNSHTMALAHNRFKKPSDNFIQ